METRSGDGTVLGELIASGRYSATAGSERSNLFNPDTAPFRTFPNQKTGLQMGPAAAGMLEMIRGAGGWETYNVISGERTTGDPAVDLAARLGLDSMERLLAVFLRVSQDRGFAALVLETTTLPFVAKYSDAPPVVVVEVDLELRLNVLANMVLNHRDFQKVDSEKKLKAAVRSSGRKHLEVASGRTPRNPVDGETGPRKDPWWRFWA